MGEDKGGDEPFAEEDEYLAYLKGERSRYAWVMRAYGGKSQEEADEAAELFYAYEPPGPYRGLVFHDEAWHWAMLTLHGHDYVTRLPHLVEPPAEYRALD
ncbi:hypothetical protein [Catenulispora subtropica]|uniref:Uncharacterized protein n=1 Tax=Catenulispora subtropica TaxID=450798 RepID=A0ABP5DX97_9ACTN